MLPASQRQGLGLHCPSRAGVRVYLVQVDVASVPEAGRGVARYHSRLNVVRVLQYQGWVVPGWRQGDREGGRMRGREGGDGLSLEAGREGGREGGRKEERSNRPRSTGEARGRGSPRHTRGRPLEKGGLGGWDFLRGGRRKGIPQLHKQTGGRAKGALSVTLHPTERIALAGEGWLALRAESMLHKHTARFYPLAGIIEQTEGTAPSIKVITPRHYTYLSNPRHYISGTIPQTPHPQALHPKHYIPGTTALHPPGGPDAVLSGQSFERAEAHIDAHVQCLHDEWV